MVVYIHASELMWAIMSYNGDYDKLARGRKCIHRLVLGYGRLD